jgi:hypothetical protein
MGSPFANELGLQVCRTVHVKEQSGVLVELPLSIPESLSGTSGRKWRRWDLAGGWLPGPSSKLIDIQGGITELRISSNAPCQRESGLPSDISISRDRDSASGGISSYSILKTCQCQRVYLVNMSEGEQTRPGSRLIKAVNTTTTCQ